MLKVISGQKAKEHDGIMFPENGKHPDEFIEYAKALVYTSKFVHLTVITNNPALIEAIDVWHEYMEIPIEYYLHDNEKGFREIPEHTLYKIYNNLGNVYDKIDVIRLMKEYNK